MISEPSFKKTPVIRFKNVNRNPLSQARQRPYEYHRMYETLNPLQFVRMR